MADYRLARTPEGDATLVVRRSDNAYIPSDPENHDWRNYQAWIAAGNTPDQAPPLAPEKTKDEKIDAMLAGHGLTVADLRERLNRGQGNGQAAAKP